MTIFKNPVDFATAYFSSCIFLKNKRANKKGVQSEKVFKAPNFTLFNAKDKK